MTRVLETPDEMAARLWREPRSRGIATETLYARDDQVAEAFQRALDSVDPITAARALVAELRGEQSGEES